MENNDSDLLWGRQKPNYNTINTKVIPLSKTEWPNNETRQKPKIMYGNVRAQIYVPKAV